MLLRLAIQALATYRITRFVTEDTLAEPLRDAITDRFGDPSDPANRLTPSYLVTCPYCTSIYAAALVAATQLLPRRTQPLADTLLTALALSGAVSLYHENRRTPGGWQ